MAGRCLNRQQWSAQEGIARPFFADGSFGAMARDDQGGVRQGQKLLTDAGDELVVVATGEIGAADGAGEQGVAGEEQTLLR